MSIQLGNKVRDIVTGFEGIAVARVEYLNGCVQFFVTPPAKDGKREGGEYIDHQQLEVMEGGIVAPTSNTGGVMSNAPSSTYRG